MRLTLKERTPLLWVVVGNKITTTCSTLTALNPQKERSMKKRDKYMGMDVHQATTVTCVMDAEGKTVLETTVATEAGPLLRLMDGINGPLHVTFEEGTQAAWLYAGRAGICEGSHSLRSTTKPTVGRGIERGQAGRAETGPTAEGGSIAIGVSALVNKVVFYSGTHRISSKRD